MSVSALIGFFELEGMHGQDQKSMTSSRNNTLTARGLEEPFFQLCCMLCQFLVLAGNRFLFTYLCT